MKGKLAPLTISMICVLGLYPFLETTSIGIIILNILISTVCLLAILAVSSNRLFVALALLFAIPWFIISWINIFLESPSLFLDYLSIMLLILFYLITAITIMYFILKSTKITKELLFGAVSVYLLTGGLFSMIFLLIETSFPGSFFINQAMNLDNVLNGSDFIYYSFVTLTTLGYGDIVPVSSTARSISVIEAIIGVMFLATIIGRLVGLHLTQSTRSLQ